MASGKSPHYSPRLTGNTFSKASRRSGNTTTPSRAYSGRVTSRPRHPLHSLQGSGNCSQNLEHHTPSAELQSYEPGMRLIDLADSVAVNGELSSDEDFIHSTPRLGSHIVEDDCIGQKQLISMFQQQQAMLDKVLKSQESMEERHRALEEKVAELEAKQLVPPTENSSPNIDGKRKRIVTRALSNKINILHKAFSEEKQFVRSEPYSSTHNKVVQETMIKELEDSKFSRNELRVGLRRCYENVRRSYLESRSGKERFVEDQSLRRKYRSRRERKFQRRSSFVTKKEMEEYWKFLNNIYMTEESDDPDNPNGIVEHKLPWRSNNLNGFMEDLDARAAKSTQQPLGLTARKVRKEGHPSGCLPPPDAPNWAIKETGGFREAQIDEEGSD